MSSAPPEPPTLPAILVRALLYALLLAALAILAPGEGGAFIYRAF